MGITTFSSLNNGWNNLNLTILEHGLFEGDHTWEHPDMISPFNRLYLIIDGEASFAGTQDCWDFLPGYMYLIPAGFRFSYQCASVIHKFYLHFNLELLPGVDLFGPLDTFCMLPCPDGLLDALLAGAKQESLLGLLSLKPLIWDIIHRFFLETANKTDYLHYFEGFYRQQHVLGYLTRHLSAALRIPELAEALNTSPHLLSRSFRKDTGFGLKEYMEHLLLQKARHLLLHTNLPICRISEQLGFSDPYYFSRFFKKQEELSPREYRRQGF